MGKSLMDRIQAKLELFRLEQRYTRRRHRRSTFVSNAVYVDGEYIYQTPNSTGGSSTGSSNINALHGEKAVVTTTAVIPGPLPDPIEESPAPIEQHNADRERKRLNRFSSIPHFGGNYNNGSEMPSIKERRSSMIR